MCITVLSVHLTSQLSLSLSYFAFTRLFYCSNQVDEETKRLESFLSLSLTR